jgi:preprotein translocase subunit YajC
MSVFLSLVSSPLVLIAGGAPDQLSAFLRSMMLPMIIIGVLFYFMLIRPERSRRSQMEKMIENLKKNDRVVTIGGIYGTVVNVQKGLDDITIKVDESTNTKLRILRSSVARVLTTENQGTEKKDAT